MGVASLASNILHKRLILLPIVGDSKPEDASLLAQ
jgi:hypothetical protein